jgi:general secretion pathway protein L
MPATLAIRLSAHAKDAAESVLVLDGAPEAAVQTDTLANLARRADGHKVCVLVPGADVLLTRARVPMRGNARILQAVPYALEEQIAADVSDLHFAIGKRDAEGRVAVAAVARARIEEWLAQLAAAGLKPQSLLADTGVLPGVDRGAVVLLEGDRACVRCLDGTPLESKVDELEQVLDVAGVVVEAESEATDPEGARALVVYASDEDQARHADLIERLRARAERVELRSTMGHPLRILASEAVKPDALNLLQGTYAPRTAIDTLWKPWRTAAMLLAAFLVVTLGLQSVRLIQLNARERQLDAAAFDILSKSCGVRALADARAQMQRCMDERLGNVAGGEDLFLEMLGTLAAALAETPGTQVTHISYRNRVLDLKLTVPDIDTLERIKSLVADRGALQMDIAQTSPGEGKVESQIELKKPTA